MMKSFFFVTILLISFGAKAQFAERGTTSKTSMEPTYNAKDQAKKKYLLAWIKNSPKNTLIGNKCMDEVTREMGFEYVLQPKGQPGNRSDVGRFVHNLGVKISLLFKNGPLWKIKLKKKYKECKASTGDYVG